MLILIEEAAKWPKAAQHQKKHEKSGSFGFRQ